MLMDYGTGAMFGCPAHDQRDLEFVNKYGLGNTPVVCPPDVDPTTFVITDTPYDGDGRMINSRFLDGMTTTEAKEEVAKRLEQESAGNRPVAKRQVNFRLRDWGISRQRYWGCPIPIIHCEACGIVPVPEQDLPVTLPDDVTFDRPGNPLDRHPTWKHVKCPQCGAPATRETDTMDTFVELVVVFRALHRSVDHDRADRSADGRRLDAGRPIYRRHRARDPASALQPLLHPGDEEDQACRSRRAVRRLVHARHGRARDLSRTNGEWVTPAEVKIEDDGDTRRATLIATGETVEIGPIEKMSKSKRNTVDPDEIIGGYGADVARWFMLSDSPPERDVEWTERGVQGVARFVQRLWRLVGEAAEMAQSAPAERPSQFSAAATTLRKATHPALAKVTDDIEKLHFNVCVAAIYEFANALSGVIGEIDEHDGANLGNASDLAWAIREAVNVLVQLFHPMMPHLAEECWAVLGHKTLVAEAAWPAVERALLIEDTMTLPVQVNGKKRDEVTVARNATNAEIEAAVLALDAVKKALDGKAPKKVIIVPQRIVNVVA